MPHPTPWTSAAAPNLDSPLPLLPYNWRTYMLLPHLNQWAFHAFPDMKKDRDYHIPQWFGQGMWWTFFPGVTAGSWWCMFVYSTCRRDQFLVPFSPFIYLCGLPNFYLPPQFLYGPTFVCIVNCEKQWFVDLRLDMWGVCGLGLDKTLKAPFYP